MIKDLVLPWTRGPGADHVLDVASALADGLQARLAVLVSLDLPIPMAGQWGMAPDLSIGDLYADLREDAEAEAARLGERLARGTAAHELRLVESVLAETAWTFAMHARHADLAIVAGGAGDGDAGSAAHVAGALLMASGRPLLVVPPRAHAPVLGGHAVVAWQPTREATRALHDALPLLKAARSVQVVAVDPEAGERSYGAEPCADIAAHLARHGLSVEVRTRRRATSETVATALLELAAEREASLLVAGGYGHSRMREWALGGTTRELIEGSHLPVLLSH